MHVVAIHGLAGRPIAATIMGNAAISIGGQRHHLRLPTIRQPRLNTTDFPESQSLKWIWAPSFVVMQFIFALLSLSMVPRPLLSIQYRHQRAYRDGR